MSTWINADGLEVKFGTTQFEDAKGGAVLVDGEYNQVVIEVTGTEVPSADAPVAKYVQLPDGAYLHSAELIVSDAFTSGGAATLDLGIFSDDGDGTYTVVDADGIDAAIAVGTLTADAKVESNGALIGTTLSGGGRNLVVSSGYNTAAFTAGEAKLIIKYTV